jgi:hypothetical protein
LEIKSEPARVERLKVIYFMGRLLAMLTKNIKLSRKGLPGTNAPAYFASLSVMKKNNVLLL